MLPLIKCSIPHIPTTPSSTNSMNWTGKLLLSLRESKCRFLQNFCFYCFAFETLIYFSLLSLGFLLPAELWWTPAVGFERSPSHHTPLITVITQLDPAGPMESVVITDRSSFIFGRQPGNSLVLMNFLSVVLWPSGKLISNFGPGYIVTYVLSRPVLLKFLHLSRSNQDLNRSRDW